MEYPDVVDATTTDATVRLTHQLGLAWIAPLEELAAEAVMQTFCSCVTTAEDAAEQRFSAIHEQIIADVVARVRSTGGAA